MLSTLLAACVKDILSLVRTESFFACSSDERRARVKRVMHAGYPQALAEYLIKVSEQSFVEELQSILPIVTSAKGLADSRIVRSLATQLPVQSTSSADEALSVEFWSDLQALLSEIGTVGEQEARQNQLVHAFAEVLTQEIAGAFDQESTQAQTLGPAVSEFLEHVFTTGRSIELGYQIQKFLREQFEVASPVIQSPSPLSSKEKSEIRSVLRKRYTGSFPVFEVETSLGGGLRIFVQGTLLDESWMTQITRLLTDLAVR